MLREMGDALEQLTVERPLVLVCEELHQSDRSTTELLAYLARRPEPARLLLVGTYRSPEVVSQSHPLREVGAGPTRAGAMRVSPSGAAEPAGRRGLPR